MISITRCLKFTYVLPCFLALTFVTNKPFAKPKNVCFQQAKTALENLYCEIKNQGEGSTLPSFSDFRRNTPAVQTLLLKQPAQKLRLTIPTVTKRHEKQPHPQQTTVDSEKITEPTALKIPTEPKESKPEKIHKKTETKLAPPYSPLAGCQLKQHFINCSDQTLKLITNLPNDQLPESALTEDNSLKIPRWIPSRWNSEDEYLEAAYRIYIEKMISIGLGAATMPYGRFYDHYRQLKKQQVDFRGRFTSMFEYLKSDKKNMAVPATISDQWPTSLNTCRHLRSDLITCDDGFTNWLYQTSDLPSH